MKIAPRNTVGVCYNHYCKQAGLGGGPYFEGGRFQRGSGLLDNFRHKVFPLIMPMLKNAALGAGRYILRKGDDFLSDVDRGVDIKTAARGRFGEVKSDFLRNVLGRQGGSGRRGKKRKRGVSISAPFPHAARQKGGRKVRCAVKRKKTKGRKRDIFD